MNDHSADMHMRDLLTGLHAGENPPPDLRQAVGRTAAPADDDHVAPQPRSMRPRTFSCEGDLIAFCWFRWHGGW